MAGAEAGLLEETKRWVREKSPYCNDTSFASKAPIIRHATCNVESTTPIANHKKQANVFAGPTSIDKIDKDGITKGLAAPRSPTSDVAAPRSPTSDVAAPRSRTSDVAAPRSPTSDVVVNSVATTAETTMSCTKLSWSPKSDVEAARALPLTLTLTQF